MSMRKRISAGLGAAALALLPLNAAAAQAPAQVVIVHGVPGLTVDVLVNGAVAVAGFRFADEPVVTTLPAGTYTLAVAAAGTTTPVLSLDATLTAGTSVTVAAHLDAAGQPKLAAYANQNSATGIQPFHLANFGAVDILSGTTAVLAGVTNGQTARIDVPGGTTVPAVGIGAAGTNVPAISLGDMTVKAGELRLVYAIGPNTGATLPTVVQAAVAVTPAARVPSGEAGLATSALPAGVLGLMALGLALALTPTVARRRG
jgi:hypothetical protein